jgi:hypothetical protein
MESIVPRRGKGRPTKEGDEVFQAGVEHLVEFMKKIQSSVDFKMSSRGWCYSLEPYGLLKSDFDYAQRLINDCRKAGFLPVGFMLDEEGRSFDTWEPYIEEDTPEDYAESKIADLFSEDFYTPFSFWDRQECYVQMLVEKIDLKSLFSKLCKRYQIPIATTKGWSSIGQREELIGRYQEHDEKQGVLLYCGDHDPAGLVISDTLRKNLNDLERSTGWRADDLIIDRFGLNFDFIEENKLTWIENLETGSGKYPLNDSRHPDHKKPYVQNYLKTVGVRKCEANAIVVAPAMGRQLCEKAINKYIRPESVEEYWNEIKEQRQEVKEHIIRLVQEGAIESYLE